MGEHRKGIDEIVRVGRNSALLEDFRDEAPLILEIAALRERQRLLPSVAKIELRGRSFEKHYRRDPPEPTPVVKPLPARHERAVLGQEVDEVDRPLDGIGPLAADIIALDLGSGPAGDRTAAVDGPG